MTEKVSVIIPFYNEEKYIERCVKSILTQTYENVEVILIDDFSSDNSLEICHSIADERIKIIKREGKANRNRSFSRNLGINKASGKYILIQDADDYSHPGRIEKQVEKIHSLGNNCVVGCFVKKIKGNTEIDLKLPVDNEEIIKGFNRMFNRVTIVAGTILAQKDLMSKFPYREKFKYYEDWDMLLRMYESNLITFHNVPEYLYYYNIHDEGTLFEKDWVDYNLFLRNCQNNRRHQKPEYGSIDEYYEALRNNNYLNLQHKLMQIMLKTKKYLATRSKSG
jgi:glycosyltransferase involved in cell wall biosynthesis